MALSAGRTLLSLGGATESERRTREEVCKHIVSTPLSRATNRLERTRRFLFPSRTRD